MFLDDDVIDLERRVVGRLGHLAVFAAAVGTPPDQSPRCRVHRRVSERRGYRA
jgi:hypothetical protein